MLGSVCLEESVGIEPFHPIFCSVWLKNVGMDSSPKEEYSLKIWDEMVPEKRPDKCVPPSLQTLPCYFSLKNLQMKVHNYNKWGEYLNLSSRKQFLYLLNTRHTSCPIKQFMV